MPVALLIAFVLVPLAEIYVISRVGHVLGLPWTLGLLLLISVVGAALVKREGLRTWHALRSAMSAGQMPAKALADAALVLVGGVLLLTPGFLTDLVGVALVLPPTRAVVRRLLTTFALRRALGGGAARRRGSSSGTTGSSAQGHIIEGIVLPDHDTTKPRPG